jgi:hypothetical protein
MTADGVDAAEGLESCHRCPRCKLVVVAMGPLAAYRAAHPRSWAAVKRVFTETLGESIREDGSNIHVVRIDPD